MRVPQDAKIDVGLDHDRKAFGRITGSDKKDEAQGGVTESH